MKYTVNRWPGIAVYIHSFPQVWDPYTSLEVDEDGNEYEQETGEGEWVDQDESCGQAYVVMVGDDKKHLVDLDDLLPLAEEAYCRDCGQVGCGHNNYE